MAAKTNVATSDKSKPYFPLASIANDGYNKDNEATATCFCGAVQIAFPTEAPGLVDSFVCNCTDCHKITASMFASNFIADDNYVRHLRGEDNLTSWSNNKTIQSGNTMTNYFCKTCGSLLYRVSTGWPGKKVMRIGTIDDFNLIETKLKPRVEQFTKDRVSWLHGADGVPQVYGNHYAGEK
ncbi:MAG: hypothetical protein M1822_008564 [Bathelium mastoideum]|nr:MAG: hypothetical protein M1822_008564 [Bathelium mastoideum]